MADIVSVYCFESILISNDAPTVLPSRVRSSCDDGTGDNAKYVALDIRKG